MTSDSRTGEVDAARLVGGMHAVAALIESRPRDIEVLHHAERRRDARMLGVLDAAREAGVRCQAGDRAALSRLAEMASLTAHQGVIAELRSSAGGPQRDGLLEHLAALDGPSLVLVLDEIQDPHNLGACLRSAKAAGVSAVITTTDNSVGATPVVRKVAAGAVETISWFRVPNLARAIDELKSAGIWVYGAAGEADTAHYEVDLSGPVALVMGAEGRGLRRLTRERCDSLFSIPMPGDVESLNVSVATGVALFEACRQRAVKASASPG